MPDSHTAFTLEKKGGLPTGLLPPSTSKTTTTAHFLFCFV